ncbi:cytochrome P450 6a2 isoform X2 [Bicyclus anynana]|uniref:unspecific monooxygenase n=1 Tax=Bicyclus anynana TaxID=110368 RepID=A0A6J1MRH9_BICAN|nr:cytochrome P450 6a2 isoform X2 [Bicyclus anynana]
MFLLLAIVLLFLAYIYTTRNHDYWIKRGVKHDTPLPLFGNHFRNVFAIKSLTAIANEMYKKYPDEKVVGYFTGVTPNLIIRDPDIARDILNVHFDHFYPRGLGRDHKKEPLMGNLFNVDGDTWKLLRARLTPAFTTAKLKAMFPLIIKCAEKLDKLGKDIVNKGGDFDARELMARFTTEFIGACGFGIEMDTINNENSMFREIGKNVFKRSLRDVFLFGIWELFPEVRGMVTIMEKDGENVFIDLITKIFQQRNFKSSGRNDFIDLLLDLAAKGRITGDSIEHKEADGTPKKVEMDMDLNCLIAQVFVFFAAGFETSSSATSYTLLELALNPEIQRKIQDEIDQVLLKHDNKLCYDSVAEMTLLDKAFKESMRLFPSVATLHRDCAKQYTIKELGLTIDPGVKIIIPIQALQTDEKYFDNPDVFMIDRVIKEDATRQKYIYMPFGEGPRSCIGARLGQMQSLAGLAAVLHKFSVEPGKKTQRKLKINHRLNVIQGVVDGIPLKLKLRDK